MVRAPLAVSFAVCLLVTSAVMAQAPPEVENVDLDPDKATLSWSAATGADVYNVYRGDIVLLKERDIPGACHAFGIAGTSFASVTGPPPGIAWFYLVTAESSSNGEGTPGFETAGPERDLLGRCGPVMRTHVLNRIGFGWDEWTRDRVAALGLQGYLDELLDPASIDESTNTDLNTRLANYEPDGLFELIGRQIVTGVYARRQLEHQYATFWTNHFNTYWIKISNIFRFLYPQCDDQGMPENCDPNFPDVANLETSLSQQREYDDFRDIGFNGNFRQMIDASAKSPAMIIFLDTILNGIDPGPPNENYGRELAELYTMGVDGGYTQDDVEELARVFTGWTICKHKTTAVGNPLAECIDNYWLPEPVGEWDAVFDATNHDCGQKVLFAGTAEEAIIPDTCSNIVDGVNDVDLALDAIVAHPSTARFISKKILQRFVTDTPTEAMIDVLVAEWNDAGNPQGVGDLREVLRAALELGFFLDPDMVGSKIKTPVEHFVSALRAIRGNTDGITTIFNYLRTAQHVPYYNAVPTGWPETGGSWIDTTNTLERQNFGVHVSALDAVAFGSSLIIMLNENGVSTAPGNAEEIVDFFIDALYGGALTPAERQEAIDFLNTDNLGTPSPYDDTRIRRMVGFLLGYAQFQEQ